MTAGYPDAEGLRVVRRYPRLDSFLMTIGFVQCVVGVRVAFRGMRWIVESWSTAGRADVALALIAAWLPMVTGVLAMRARGPRGILAMVIVLEVSLVLGWVG